MIRRSAHLLVFKTATTVVGGNALLPTSPGHSGKESGLRPNVGTGSSDFGGATVSWTKMNVLLYKGVAETSRQSATEACHKRPPALKLGIISGCSLTP